MIENILLYKIIKSEISSNTKSINHDNYCDSSHKEKKIPGFISLLYLTFKKKVLKYWTDIK